MKKISVVVSILSILTALLGGIFVYQYGRFSDEKLHLILCDVGQGDAIFIRSPTGSDILIDGGPNDKVLSCLKDNMPFWDKEIELLILTHPHADHLNGLIPVLKNYKVMSFTTVNLQNNTAGFKRLVETLKDQNIDIRYLYAGDAFKFRDKVKLQIVGPSKEFLLRTSPTGLIGENKEFANIETLVVFNSFSALLTGDSQATQLKEAVRLVKISILQVPHHGSKTGLDSEILDILKPELAVISVGKNRYGHPAEPILQMLTDKDIKILRTDKDGEIEIVSDGQGWVVSQ